MKLHAKFSPANPLLGNEFDVSRMPTLPSYGALPSRGALPECKGGLKKAD